MRPFYHCSWHWSGFVPLLPLPTSLFSFLKTHISGSFDFRQYPRTQWWEKARTCRFEQRRDEPAPFLPAVIPQLRHGWRIRERDLHVSEWKKKIKCKILWNRLQIKSCIEAVKPLLAESTAPSVRKGSLAHLLEWWKQRDLKIALLR